MFEVRTELSRTPRPSRVLALLVVVLAALARGDAQEPQPPPNQGQPTFRVEANFVRVDVYPTVDGQPVQDLTAADFEVVEDGAAQKIETFEHVVVRGFSPQEG